MLHLLLKISPKLCSVISYKRQGSIVGTTEITSFVERHRCTDIHVAGIKDQRPTRRAFFTIENRSVVHVQWQILNLQKLWVVGKIFNTRADSQRFIPVPEIVCCVDLRLVDIARAGDK